MRALLIDLASEDAKHLATALARAGIECRSTEKDSDLYDELERWPPELIFVRTGSPRRDVLEHVAHTRRDSPQTIISLFGRASEGIARLAAELDISLYAISSLRDSLLQALIDIAISELHSHQQLQTEVAAAQFSSKQRLKTHEAITFIVDNFSLAPHQAEALLKKNAQRQNRSVEDLADQLLSTGSMG